MPDPADEDALRADLDRAIRSYAATELFNDGEYIVAWIGLAAIIRADGGGAVVTLPGPGDCLPFWQMRGILADAMASVDRQADANRRGRDDD